MEKRKPHYPLKDIQEKVRSEGADVFTRTAIEKSKEMGLTIQQAIDVVCSMTSECFYKSMTTIIQARFGKTSTTLKHQ